MKKFAFSKTERLTSQRQITQLLESGMTHTFYPFRIYWMVDSGFKQPPVRVAFSVSKKRIKKAVVRNLMKRRIREAYRKNKDLLSPFGAKANGLSILFVYISNDALPYSLIAEKLTLTLQHLIACYEKSH